MGLFTSLTAISQVSVKIIETSSSKKSLIINRGAYEGVQVGQEGFLYIRTGQVDKPELSKVAEVRVVKTVKKHSFWYVTKIENEGELHPGSLLTFYEKGQFLEGRSEFKARELLIVGEEKELEQRDEFYELVEELDRTEVVKNEDVEFNIHTNYQNVAEYGEKSVKGTSPYKRKDIKKLKNYYKDKIYKSTVEGSVKKINKQKNGLLGLYKDSAPDPHVKWLKKRDWIYNTYESANYDKRNDILVDPRAKRRMQKEGDMWSSSMSDHELRDFFMRNGIAEEKRRQEFAIDNRIGNEAFVRYSWNTTVNYSDADQNNQGQGYSFVFGYEYHLIRAIKKLENWSVDVFWELALDYYDLGDINGKAQMSFLGTYINYYFYNLPTSIKKFIWYAGIGLKFGNAEIDNPELDATYDYGVQALPSYQVGIKYRFDSGDEVDDLARIGWGVNFLFQTSLLKFNTNDQIVDDINGSFQAQDTRFSVGLAFIF